MEHRLKRAISKHYIIALFTVLNTAGNNQTSINKGMAKKIVTFGIVQKEVGKILILSYQMKNPEAKLQMSYDFNHIFERIKRKKFEGNTLKQLQWLPLDGAVWVWFNF